VIAVGKHFPGHGDTDRDSHLTLPVVHAARARLDTVELVPFRRAIADDIGGIMVAHIAVPALADERTPATLSYAVTTRLLRHELGFDGLVITDALNMSGVTREGEGSEVALRAVRAGADILLQPPNAELAIDAIVEAVQRGDLSAARVDGSVRRILRAKARLASSGSAAPTWTRGDTERLAADIAARSIVLGRDSAALLPIAGGQQVLSLAYSTVAVPGGPNEAFDFALRSSGVAVTRRALPTRRALAVADSLVDAWRSDVPPLVVVGIYAQPVAGRGTTGLPPAVVQSLDRVARAAPTVVVFFGDPYAATELPSASTVLFAWSGIPAAQRAAARALLGQAPVTGTLPVRLE
jgi:beta-N-acetylhexosaminidase